MHHAAQSAAIHARAREDIAPREPTLIQTRVYPVGEHGWAVAFTYAEDSETEPGKQHVTRKIFNGTHWSD